MLSRSVRKWFAGLCLVTPLVAMAQEKPTVAIAREHVSHDCASGILKVEGEVIAYIIAKSHKSDNTRLGSLIPGTFDGQLRGNPQEGWDITYTPIPNQPTVHMHLGRRSIANVRGIEIGDQLAGTCHFAKSSQYARAAQSFERHLPASGADGTLSIRLKIEDR